ncbi:MAG: hypothetical protein WCF22_20280 [Candidatus Sulfotelmatobacter sp.]
MPQEYLLSAAIILAALNAMSQQVSETPSTQPQVKVNVLNVCTPSAQDQKEIAGAVTHIPTHPAFSDDFEISHGRSTLDQSPNFLQPGQNAKMSDEPSVASYVRIRREFAGQAMFSNVQYSFSNDGKTMVETLVLHVRDPKELMQISMEDSASAIGSAESMVAANTPASRIRLERFGRASIALARCEATENGPAPDQSAYEPLFESASQVLADYRSLLGVRRMVPAELAQIPRAWNNPTAKRKPAKSAKAK